MKKNPINQGKPEEVALARYAVIAPLVCREMSREELWEEIKRVANVVHRFPDGHRRVSRRSIRRWRQYYLKGRAHCEPGLEALHPKERTDQGEPRILPPEIIERAVALREEMPSRKTGRIIELLKLEAEAGGLSAPEVKESTLNYHLRRKKATRKRLRSKGRAFRRFQHPHRNSCWQGDWADGIWLEHPTKPGKSRKCYLHAFIDDRTRYIPHAEFYLRQNLPCLEDCLRKAILKGGIPEMTYVDNGSSYQAGQFKKIAARLGTNLVFATEFCPEGKGKVERWIRTVKDDFFAEAQVSEVKNLEELNTFLWAWLEVYHDRIHSSTKATPRQLWRTEVGRARVVEPEKLVDIFLWEETRKVDKSGTFQLDGNRYPVSEHLVREVVEVRFNPFDLEKVRVYYQGLFVESTSPEKLVTRTSAKAMPRRHDKKAPLESSKAFRRQVVEGYQAQVRQVMSALPGQIENAAYLTEKRFVQYLAEALGRNSLRKAERNLAFEFFQSYAPLPQDTVTRTLAESVSEQERDLHLRVYLRKIKEALSGLKGAF